MQDQQDEPTIPPEGTACRQHPDEFAVVVCPECARPSCMTCWHMEISQCHLCAVRTSHPPIAWESNASLPARFVHTLLSAFRPSTCIRFGRSDIRKAAPFFVASFVPVALLSGIIPFTATLGFGDAFGVQWIGEPTSAEVLVDIVQATIRGLVLSALQVLAIGASFTSLLRAYANHRVGAAPLQVIAYRAFLVPLSWLLTGIITWGIPASQLSPAPSLLAQVAMIPTLVPLVFMFASLRSTARMSGWVSPISGFVISTVSMLFMLVTTLVINTLLMPNVEFEPGASAAVVEEAADSQAD